MSEQEPMFPNPLACVEKHGQELARRGYEPSEIVRVAQVLSHLKPHDPKETVILKGYAADVHALHTPDHPIIPGLEYVR